MTLKFFTAGLDLFRKKKLRVRANDGANTAFMITAKELGYIRIRVTATSALAGDTVERKLLVKVSCKPEEVLSTVWFSPLSFKAGLTDQKLKLNGTQSLEFVCVLLYSDLPALPFNRLFQTKTREPYATQNL